MLVKQTPTSRYNPNAIRRCVRRDASQPKGISTFTTKSFTRENGPEHHPAIDLETGEVRCTCEHFRYRLAPTAAKCDASVTIQTPMLHCKHIERAIENCVRSGELTRDESKVLHLVVIQSAPVEVPEHVDAQTGEVKPGYNPDGSFDYLSYFDA